MTKRTHLPKWQSLEFGYARAWLPPWSVGIEGPLVAKSRTAKTTKRTRASRPRFPERTPIFLTKLYRNMIYGNNPKRTTGWSPKGDWLRSGLEQASAWLDGRVAGCLPPGLLPSPLGDHPAPRSREPNQTQGGANVINETNPARRFFVINPFLELVCVRRSFAPIGTDSTRGTSQKGGQAPGDLLEPQRLCLPGPEPVPVLRRSPPWGWSPIGSLAPGWNCRWPSIITGSPCACPASPSACPPFCDNLRIRLGLAGGRRGSKMSHGFWNSFSLR